MKKTLIILTALAGISLNSCAFTAIGSAIDHKIEIDHSQSDTNGDQHMKLTSKDLHLLNKGCKITVISENGDVIQGEYGGIHTKKAAATSSLFYNWPDDSLQILIDDEALPVSDKDIIIRTADNKQGSYVFTIMGVAADVVLIGALLKYSADNMTFGLSQ